MWAQIPEHHVNLSSTCFAQPKSNLTMLSVSEIRTAQREGGEHTGLECCVQDAGLNFASVHKLKPHALATKFMTKFQVQNFKQKSEVHPSSKTSPEMIMDQIRDRKPVQRGIFHLWFSHSSSADLCLSPGSFFQLQLGVACGFEGITLCYLIHDLFNSGYFENFFLLFCPIFH